MKQKLLISLLSFSLILAIWPAWAQEEAGEIAKPVPEKQEKTDIIKDVQSAASGWINKIIGYISQIGALFGKNAGFRIGGTTGTAIAMLVIAKIIEDKTPSWVKWILYAGGGTMFAGSGANIAEVIMKQIGL